MTAPQRNQGSQDGQHQRQVVLVALDGSPSAATALPVARLAAERLGAALEILHVASTDLSDADLADLRRRLGLDTSGLRGAAVRLLIGDPAAEILRSAADPQVALVVVTTHGYMPEFGRSLGRVAEAVVAGAERPILLVRPEAALAPDAWLPALQRFLIPLDGTPTTARVLPPITELACRLGASLDVLLVAATDDKRPEEPGSISPPRYIDQLHYEWPAWQAEAIHRLCTVCAECPADMLVRMYLARGPISDEILRFAAEHRTDAIVLVRRSRLEQGRGVVIRQVLERAPCPILLVGKPAPNWSAPAD